MSEPEWSVALEEWLYGPPRDEEDEPESVGEMYRRQEEEDRLRWIPGYAGLVEAYLAALARWHASWIPGEGYPPEPAEVARMKSKISEYQRTRAEPPSHG